MGSNVQQRFKLARLRCDGRLICARRCHMLPGPLSSFHTTEDSPTRGAHATEFIMAQRVRVHDSMPRGHPKSYVLITFPWLSSKIMRRSAAVCIAAGPWARRNGYVINATFAQTAPCQPRKCR